MLKFFKDKKAHPIISEITLEKKTEIKKLAYVPEHIVPLMESISKGRAYKIESFIYYLSNNNLLFIGYPLSKINYEDIKKSINRYIDGLIKIYEPNCIFIIAPEIPEEIKENASEFQKDYYYSIKMDEFKPQRRLLREVEKVSAELTVKEEKVFTKKHREIREEFLGSKNLHPLVKSLYNSIEFYLGKSDTVMLLSAYSDKQELTAYYCIESWADNFLAYILGCHSKIQYIPHASDLLFLEMINIAKKLNKKEVNLGLGVNEGIRKFKEKWGGRPVLPYEYIEWKLKGEIENFFTEFQKKL